MAQYDQVFFRGVREGARSSARALVPLLLDWINPSSVADVGCGDGTWLSVVRERGVADVLGFDGDYVPRETLQIPPELFAPIDLREPPVEPPRRFDLALCLEVAEHLPAESADELVRFLADLAPVICFSAAIPHQGGRGHFNEQWPDYWIERFAEEGFVAIDGVRPRLWDDPDVEPWYAQNSFLYVEESQIPELPAEELRKLAAAGGRWPTRLVHPRSYLGWVDRCAALKDDHRAMHVAADELGRLVPPGSTIVLVDDAQFEPWALPKGRQVRPFLEKDGQFWGAPVDDAEAITELECMRRGEADYLVFGWPAFWWLDHYAGFRRHLDRHFRRVIESERLIVYDLRTS